MNDKQERKHIKDEAEGARLMVELDTIIQHKMAHGTLEAKQYDGEAPVKF